MLGTLYLIHHIKLLQAFSKHAKDQHVFACNHSFLILIQNHGCKEILLSLYHAEKIADAVLLYVFNIGFPASVQLSHDQMKLDVTFYKSVKIICTCFNSSNIYL